MSWVALMYHDVQPAPPVKSGGPARFTVSTASFARMLDVASGAGYEVSSLERARSAGAGRRVAVTFDDGTLGQFEHAAPALTARSMSATFCVVTDWVGREGFMSWEQLRELKRWGMSIQSHTVSHPHLSELAEHDLRRELEESRRVLDAELDQRTTELALPGGNAPRLRLRGVLEGSGYEAVASSRWGTNAVGGGGGVRRVRRCNVPRELDDGLALRIVSGDRRLMLRHYPREALLNGARALLGADRYARWRRGVLDALASS